MPRLSDAEVKAILARAEVPLQQIDMGPAESYKTTTTTYAALCADLLAARAERDRLRTALGAVIEAQDAVDAWVADESESNCETVPSAALYDAIYTARALLAESGEGRADG